MKVGASLPGLEEAQERVLHVQRKPHEWASDDAEREFCDLWNLEYGEILGINRRPSRPSEPSQTVSTKPGELHLALMLRLAARLAHRRL